MIPVRSCGDLVARRLERPSATPATACSPRCTAVLAFVVAALVARPGRRGEPAVGRAGHLERRRRAPRSWWRRPVRPRASRSPPTRPCTPRRGRGRRGGLRLRGLRALERVAPGRDLLVQRRRASCRARPRTPCSARPGTPCPPLSLSVFAIASQSAPGSTHASVAIARGGGDGEERDRVVEPVRAQGLVAVGLQLRARSSCDGLARRDLAGVEAERGEEADRQQRRVVRALLDLAEHDALAALGAPAASSPPATRQRHAGDLGCARGLGPARGEQRLDVGVGGRGGRLAAAARPCCRRSRRPGSRRWPRAPRRRRCR